MPNIHALPANCFIEHMEAFFDNLTLVQNGDTISVPTQDQVYPAEQMAQVWTGIQVPVRTQTPEEAVTVEQAHRDCYIDEGVLICVVTNPD